uniref:Uncharacterized protein n=1 Tax=viral metagenome TaxID=1070528 RepID=A0A6H1ZS04_9ZZZZ
MKKKIWCCDCKYFKVKQYGDNLGICQQKNEMVGGRRYHDNCSNSIKREYEGYQRGDNHNNERCLK